VKIERRTTSLTQGAIPSEESETRKKKLETAPKFSKFLADVGNGIWQGAPAKLGETWKGDKVVLSVQKDGTKVTATGVLEKVQTGNALSSAFTGNTEKSVDRFQVTVTCQLLGSVLVGDYVTERQRNPSKSVGFLDMFPTKKDFIGIFDAENRELRCIIDKEFKEFDVKDEA